MRLLNTETLELQYFIPGRIPDYVILSHRWCTPSSEECTFEDINKTPISNRDSLARKKQGFSKIQGSCDLAFRDSYQWIWIDSCCIDKSSSAELHEAINSMWNYYANSNICYVYMADILDSEAGRDQRFCQSEWFTRGWTLQELIAPTSVEFYAKNWSLIGTKFEQYKEIANITGIDREVLLQTQNIDYFSALERLSWAAHRQVTREEDEAYSLLGLFDVNMPLIYGEGQEKAFIRLQEAIYNKSTDHSLFLFRYSLHHGVQPLLADSPKRFCDNTECTLCILRGVHCFPSNIPITCVSPTMRWATQAHEQIMPTVTAFRNEMSTTLPLLDYQDVSDKLIFFDNSESRTGVTHVAVLNHSLKKYMKGALCLLLRRTGHAEVFQRLNVSPQYCRILQATRPGLKTPRYSFVLVRAVRARTNVSRQRSLSMAIYSLPKNGARQPELVILFCRYQDKQTPISRYKQTYPKFRQSSRSKFPAKLRTPEIELWQYCCSW